MLWVRLGALENRGNISKPFRKFRCGVRVLRRFDMRYSEEANPVSTRFAEIAAPTILIRERWARCKPVEGIHVKETAIFGGNCFVRSLSADDDGARASGRASRSSAA